MKVAKDYIHGSWGKNPWPPALNDRPVLLLALVVQMLDSAIH